MKLVVTSVFDVDACVYAQPVFVLNEKVARRGFGDAVKQGDSPLAVHRGSFRLYKIADWDDNTGEFKSYQPPVLLCNASDFEEVIKKEDA